MRSPQALTFDRDGAERAPGALGAQGLAGLEALLQERSAGRAGVRLYGVIGLGDFLDATGPVGALAARVLGAAARPVRAILFDKTAARNWALGWHQDRVVA